MREILFRGKRLEIGRFAIENVCEWTYGGYAKDCSGVHIYNSMTSRRMVRVKPDTVCQYTGLTDKNDVKIFEGDIVDAPDRNFKGLPAEVRFMPDASFCVNRVGYPPIHLKAAKRFLEVVGNIYDNPELL